MSPDEVADMLLTGCPECGRDIEPDDLCEHDDPITGPLCRQVCCPKLHRVGLRPWRTAA